MKNENILGIRRHLYITVNWFISFLSHQEYCFFFRSDYESQPTSVLNLICPKGSVIAAQCKDEKGEPFKIFKNDTVSMYIAQLSMGLFVIRTTIQIKRAPTLRYSMDAHVLQTLRQEVRRKYVCFFFFCFVYLKVSHYMWNSFCGYIIFNVIEDVLLRMVLLSSRIYSILP